MKDTNVAEPRYINETIEKFDKLLTDQESPIISNTIGLSDSINIESGDNSILMNEIVKARKLTKLIDGVENISEVIDDMNNHLEGHTVHISQNIQNKMNSKWDEIKQQQD